MTSQKLDQLPHELLQLIFHHLCPYSLTCMSAVCWGFRHIATDESLWQNCCQCLYVHPICVGGFPHMSSPSSLGSCASSSAENTSVGTSSPSLDPSQGGEAPSHACWNELTRQWHHSSTSSAQEKKRVCVSSKLDGEVGLLVKIPYLREPRQHSCRLKVASVLANFVIVDPSHVDDLSVSTTSRPVRQTIAAALKKLVDLKRHLPSTSSKVPSRQSEDSVSSGFPYSRKSPVFGDLLQAMKHVSLRSAQVQEKRYWLSRRSKAGNSASSDGGSSAAESTLIKPLHTILLLPGCYYPQPPRGFPLQFFGNFQLIGASNDPSDVQFHVPVEFGKGTQVIRNVTFYSGVEVTSGTVQFLNCDFTSGLDLRGGSGPHLVTGCRVTDHGGNGITIRSSVSAVVEGCLIARNRASAIDLQSSGSVTISRNQVHSNGNGLVVCGGGKVECVISENEIARSLTAGIIVKQKSHAVIANNKISRCGWGLVMKDESTCVFQENECHANLHSAICLQSSTNSKFLRNYIHDERRGVVLDCPPEERGLSATTTATTTNTATTVTVTATATVATTSTTMTTHTPALELAAQTGVAPSSSSSAPLSSSSSSCSTSRRWLKTLFKFSTAASEVASQNASPRPSCSDTPLDIPFQGLSKVDLDECGVHGDDSDEVRENAEVVVAESEADFQELRQLQAIAPSPSFASLSTCAASEANASEVKANTSTTALTSSTIETCSPLFQGNVIQDCFRCGIALKCGGYARILRNEISGCRRGIFLQKRACAVIRENEVGHSQRSGVEAESFACVLLQQNTIHHCGEIAILCTSFAKAKIRKNEISDNPLLAIAVKSHASPVIVENTIRNHRRAIDLSDATDALLAHNTITDFIKTAVTVRGSSQAILRGNSIRNGRHGIVVYGTCPCVIEKNHFVQNVTRAALAVRRHTTPSNGSTVTAVEDITVKSPPLSPQSQPPKSQPPKSQPLLSSTSASASASALASASASALALAFSSGVVDRD